MRTGRLLTTLAALAVGAALIVTTGGWGLSGLPFVVLLGLLARGRWPGERAIERWRRPASRPRRRRARPVRPTPTPVVDEPIRAGAILARACPRRGPPSFAI